MTTDDEIRRILNDKDVEIIRNRFLCALKDLDENRNRSVEFSRVYEKMGLKAYNLPLAMSTIIQDYLLPQNLIEIDDDKVKITDKGGHRCDQIRHTHELEWKETMNRLNRYRRE
jgi:hypothetical protein